MILDGDDYKKGKELKYGGADGGGEEGDGREIAEVSFLMNVDLVVNLEMIDMTHLNRR
jgi:hypothetical protein